MVWQPDSQRLWTARQTAGWQLANQVQGRVIFTVRLRRRQGSVSGAGPQGKTRRQPRTSSATSGPPAGGGAVASAGEAALGEAAGGEAGLWRRRGHVCASWMHATRGGANSGGGEGGTRRGGAPPAFIMHPWITAQARRRRSGEPGVRCPFSTGRPPPFPPPLRPPSSVQSVLGTESAYWHRADLRIARAIGRSMRDGGLGSGHSGPRSRERRAVCLV